MNTDEQHACLEPVENSVARCVFFLVPETCVFAGVCVCVKLPSQEIPDGGGTAERKIVINVSLVSVPVCLLTCVYPKERDTDRCIDGWTQFEHTVKALLNYHCLILPQYKLNLYSGPTKIK